MISAEQINEVENFLAIAKLTDEYYTEFLDHLICEIEVKMENDLSFDMAFEDVKNKWIRMLAPKRSFFLGLANRLPAIMIKDLKLAKFKNLIYCSLLTCLVMAPYFALRKDMIESENFIIRLVVLLIIAISSIYLTYKFIFNKQRYFTTIYSYMLRGNCFLPLGACILCVFLFGFLTNIDQINQINFNKLFYSAFLIIQDQSKVDGKFLTLYVFYLIVNFRLFWMHKKLVNKLEFANDK